MKSSGALALAAGVEPDYKSHRRYVQFSLFRPQVKYFIIVLLSKTGPGFVFRFASATFC